VRNRPADGAAPRAIQTDRVSDVVEWSGVGNERANAFTSARDRIRDAVAIGIGHVERVHRCDRPRENVLLAVAENRRARQRVRRDPAEAQTGQSEVESEQRTADVPGNARSNLFDRLHPRQTAAEITG